MRAAGHTLHFHATDLAVGRGEWTIDVGHTDFDWHHGHGKGDVAVRASASDLLLLVYGRIKPSDDRFETFGDQDLLARWLERTAL
jgi:hypothetical protein